MKNKKLLKILAIILAVVIVLTWIVPGTTYNGTGNLELGGVNPAGLLSIFGSFDIISTYFFQNAILVLLIGALYGVMNKTGAYKELVDNLAKVKGDTLLIVSSLLFIAVPALTNIYFPLFVLVPLFISLLLKQGHSKNTVLLATVGSILIGMTCNLSSSTFTQITGSTTNTYLWVKVGLLVLSLVVTILFLLKNASSKEKNSKKKEEESSLLIIPEKKADSKTKVNPTPLFVMLSILFVLLILGLTNWSTDIFAKMNDAIMDVSIGKNFPIFRNILGAFGAFGDWWNGEIYAVLILSTVVIGLVYKLKVWDILEGAIEGGKKFVSIALLVALVNLLIVFTLNSGFLATIITFVVASGNVALVTLASIFGTPFVVEQGYVAQYNLGMILTKLPNANKELMALISQVTYGVTMLVAPTSTVLIAGMAYLEKDYTSWVKYIWKLAVMLLILIFIAVTVASLIK
jgi:uncharacterized ion transporter superfamily protein YfcC